MHVQGIAVDVCRDGKILDLTLTLARTLTLTLALTLTLTLSRTRTLALTRTRTLTLTRQDHRPRRLL